MLVPDEAACQRRRWMGWTGDESSVSVIGGGAGGAIHTASELLLGSSTEETTKDVLDVFQNDTSRWLRAGAVAVGSDGMVKRIDVAQTVEDVLDLDSVAAAAVKVE